MVLSDIFVTENNVPFLLICTKHDLHESASFLLISKNNSTRYASLVWLSQVKLSWFSVFNNSHKKRNVYMMIFSPTIIDIGHMCLNRHTAF